MGSRSMCLGVYGLAEVYTPVLKPVPSRKGLPGSVTVWADPGELTWLSPHQGVVLRVQAATPGIQACNLC